MVGDHPAEVARLIVSSDLSRALALTGILLATVTACSAVDSGPTQKSDATMCLDGLALPVTSGAQIFLDPSRIPDLRTQAFAVLDSQSPDARITESAHDVARKMVLVIDTVEGLDPDAGLGLLGSGLDGLATLSGPLGDLADAHSTLAEACSSVGVTPSPSTTAV